MDDEDQRSIPGPWEVEIRAAWRDAAMPVPPLQNPKWRHTEPGRDGFDAEQWLTDKRWDEIAGEGESWKADLESPFYYFHPAASAYYLGGYLLEMSLPLEQEKWASECSNHFIHFYGTEEFAEMLPFLSSAKRALMSRFVFAMLEHAEAYQIDHDMISRFKQTGSFT